MTRKNDVRPVDNSLTLASILLLASVLVIAGVCIYLFIHSVHRTGAQLVTSGHVAKNETFFKNYNVVYPIFHRQKVDMTMRNYVTHQVDAFLQKVGVMSDSDNELTITYTILHYDKHTLSIMFHKYEHVVDRPDEQTNMVVTYDLDTQTQLQFVDLFQDVSAGNFLLERILHDYFSHSASEAFTGEELDELSRVTLKDVRQFAVDDDAFILYINPHHSMSNKDDVTISIKKDLFTAVLKDGYAAITPSLTQRIIEQPTYVIATMPRHDIFTGPGSKLLALTFDDGPGVLSPSLLDVLKKYGAHATFFLIGRQVPSYASTVRREISEGNEVGNHSWSHPNLTLLSPGSLQQQIGDTQRAIKDATGGYAPVLMRPPQGSVNNAVTAYIQSQGMNVQLWNVDTLDWLNRDSQVVYERILAGAGDGKVILLHDIHPTSVAAVIRAIPQLIADGYQLVTVSELHRYR